MQLASSETNGPTYPRPSEERLTRGRAQTGRILAIEPDEEVRAAMDGLLTIRGCDVRSVGSYEAAVGLLETWRADLIFLDIDAVADVAEAVAALRAGEEPTPVVVLLSRRVFGVSEATRLGAVARVQTPFDVEEVLRLVARYAPCG